jgi:hypothetical protein
MVVLRCTQKLLARLKQTDTLPAVESTTRLGDWYGNILRIGRRQHLLFISERSRLPVVIPITESKRLRTVFPDAVCERLAIVGVTAEDIADERARMSEIAFGRTRNRSLLGTLNDFAFMAQSVDARRTESLPQSSRMSRRTRYASLRNSPIGTQRFRRPLNPGCALTITSLPSRFIQRVCAFSDHLIGGTDATHTASATRYSPTRAYTSRCGHGATGLRPE